MNRPTLPAAPWEGSLTRPPAIPPFMDRLIRDVFTGKTTIADLTYMAKAILQMSDEMAEMRERIKALELAMKAALENDAGRG